MMNHLCKCKLIGDGKAKPFWAMSEDLQQAYVLCRDFMNSMIFEDESWYYRYYLDDRIFTLIKYGRGTRAYQSKHSMYGIVCKRVFDIKRKKRYQNGKIRIYDVKLNEKIQDGYLVTPHLKAVSATLKDPSGVHCKTVKEIATIMMDNIISNYFHNTLLFAELDNDFHPSLCVSLADKDNCWENTEGYRVVSSPKECLMVLFQAYLLYRDFIYKHPDEANKTPMGFYAYSSMDKNGCTYTDYVEGWTAYGHSKEFNYFDKIQFLVKQIQQSGEKPHCCHHSIIVSPKFAPYQYLDELERRTAV